MPKKPTRKVKAKKVIRKTTKRKAPAPKRKAPAPKRKAPAPKRKARRPKKPGWVFEYLTVRVKRLEKEAKEHVLTSREWIDKVNAHYGFKKGTTGRRPSENDLMLVGMNTGLTRHEIYTLFMSPDT